MQRRGACVHVARSPPLSRGPCPPVACHPLGRLAQDAKIPAGTGQRVRLARQVSRAEKLLRAARLALGDAEAKAMLAKTRNSRSRTAPSAWTRPSAQWTGSGRSSRPARVSDYALWPGTAASAGRACTGPGLFNRSASACRCAGVSGGAASASSLIQASRSVSEWGAGCPLWL